MRTGVPGSSASSSPSSCRGIGLRVVKRVVLGGRLWSQAAGRRSEGDAQDPPLRGVRQRDHFEPPVVGGPGLAEGGVLGHLGDVGEQQAVEAAPGPVLELDGERPELGEGPYHGHDLLEGALAAFLQVDGHHRGQAHADVGVGVLRPGVHAVADGQAQQVDAADLAGRDGVDERALRGGSPVVVGVARGLHRTDRVVVAGLHDPVDDLVVAAVAADRHDQRMPGLARPPGRGHGRARRVRWGTGAPGPRATAASGPRAAPPPAAVRPRCSAG